MSGKKFKYYIGPIKLYGYHGVFQEEKKLGNRFEINIFIESSIDKISHDSIEEVLDYVRIVDIVKSCFFEKKYNLLESLAQMIYNRIKEEFNDYIEDIKISVEKIPPIESVEGFRIEY